MRTIRPPALGTALLLLTILACGEDGATGPTEPAPTPPDPDVTAPAVVLALPAPDAELHGTIELRAHATDDVRVAGVQFLVDGEPYGDEIRSHPYRLLFNSRSVADGPHALSARARDAAGHATVSSPVTVAVYNQPGVVQLEVRGPEGWHDADGFQLHIDRDGSRLIEIPGTGTFTIPDLPAGTRRLTLGGLPAFCSADEQVVTVRSTAPASAVLTIGCLADAADGWLLVAQSIGAGGNRLTALSLSTGKETVLVPELLGLGAVSPDGGRLAFIDDGTLMIGDLDGFAPVAVASVPGAWEVSWSPDGSALVFASDRGGLPDLFIVDADGTDLRPVFEAPGYRRRPAWSATGRIAFEAVSGGPMGDQTTIWSADPDGANVAQLTSGGLEESPAWSPDGTRLALIQWRFTSVGYEAQVAVQDVDGSEPIAAAEALGYPIWSPDGMWIVYSTMSSLQATQVSGTPTMRVNDYGGQALAWVAGGRFD